MRSTRVNREKITNAESKKGILTKLKNYLDRSKLGDLMVVRGYISPRDLDFALLEQKLTRQPLGKIFLEHGMITRRQLTLVLAGQKGLRLIAAISLCFISLTGFAKKSRAETIEDVPARISISASQNYDQLSYYPALFGAEEKRSENLKAFTKWTSMFSRFDDTLDNGKSAKIVQNLKIELAKYKSSSVSEMAHKVNAMMNKKKYIADSKNWGKSDYWATPIEFMTRGGDCEDFAIAKYVALRALGVPEDYMRIAIVHDKQKNIPHAILIVYAEEGALVLDNQIKTVRRADSIKHYRPIFSINRTAWWLHTAPTGSETTVVASSK